VRTRVQDIFKRFTANNVLPYDLTKSYEHIEFVAKQAYSEILSEAKELDSVDQHRPPKEALRAMIGKSIRYPEEIGGHPDFCCLEENQCEYHYIASVFVDIKGSTALGTKLPLKDVRFIKNGILVTAIDMFQAFDGHVHRLQGDAIFAMFGRKDMQKADAIIDALNATSFLQFYFKYHLSKTFEKLGWPTIRIRTGMDFGDDEQVMWSLYGIKNCNEVTTTSIHTDLAAKLQAKAPGMGTMVGNNILEYLDWPDEFYTTRKRQKHNETVEDLYVINNEYLKYRMWVVDWEKYLNRFLFVERDSSFPYRCPSAYSYHCFYGFEEDKSYPHEYLPNCGSLPKRVNLKFQLNIPPSMHYHEILWEVNNRGKEATQAGQLTFAMDDYKNKTYCLQSTAYKGHHYMKCTIKYQGRIIAQEFFGVYVRD